MYWVVMCFVLCCVVLACAVLCCVVLYCVIVLSSVVLCCVMTITTDLKQSAKELHSLSLNVCPGKQTQNHKQYSERFYPPT